MRIKNLLFLTGKRCSSYQVSIGLLQLVTGGCSDKCGKHLQSSEVSLTSLVPKYYVSIPTFAVTVLKKTNRVLKKKKKSDSWSQLKVYTFACRFLEALLAPNKSPSRTIFCSAAAQLLNSAASNPSPH